MNRWRSSLVASELKVLGILLVLMLTMIGAAYLPLGAFSPLVLYGIGAAEAALVMTYFMELKGGARLTVVFAIAGFFWLAFLFVLSLSDFLTRPTVSAPW